VVTAGTPRSSRKVRSGAGRSDTERHRV
jgi:hypothetical protein